MFKNNYLSLWIANLGVVPLFAIAFFLLRPAFFSLSFLLVLVCVVLDAITLSLNFILKSLFRSDKLAILLLIVKVFMTQNAMARANIGDDIFISRGEQIKLPISALKKFSVGNKEVISVTYKDSHLLIKGKSIGFSDILLLSSVKTKKVKIFVLTKREQLKKARIAQTLKSIDLRIKLEGELLKVTGSLSSQDDYKVFNKISKEIDSKNIIDVTMTKELRNEIIASIYKESYQFGAKIVSCENLDYRIFCYFKGFDLESVKSKYLIEKYSINTISHPSIKNDLNYSIKFKILKVNDSNEKVRDLGPSKINVGLKDFLNSSSRALTEGDIIEIRDTKSSATVIAQPESLVTLGSETNLSLGGEFPVVTANSIGQTTQWKYYGLKVKSKLKKKSNRLFLSFNTFLSTPFEQNINSTSGKSSIFVSPDKYIKLFQIGFNQKKLSNESIPILNKIPILKHLFTRDYSTGTFQKIICFIKIEVIDE